jgi:hypothetical protein
MMDPVCGLASSNQPALEYGPRPASRTTSSAQQIVSGSSNSRSTPGGFRLTAGGGEAPGRCRAGEDRQAIAKQCGTSVEMLERNYSFAIEDLEDEGSKLAVEERVHARTLAPTGSRRQLRAA